MKKHLLIYFIIITALSLVSGYATDSPVLVGSLEKTNEIIADATDVVIGKFTDVEATPAFGMNGQAYHGHITVLQTLKGTDSGSFAVGFSVGALVAHGKELEPNLNDTYIMILVQHQGIRKLLPATDANIAKVKALIAAVPSSK